MVGSGANWPSRALNSNWPESVRAHVLWCSPAGDVSPQRIAAAYSVFVSRQTKAGRLELTARCRERQIEPHFSINKIHFPDRTDAANLSSFYCSPKLILGERSRSLQWVPAKSGKSEIIRL